MSAERGLTAEEFAKKMAALFHETIAHLSPEEQDEAIRELEAAVNTIITDHRERDPVAAFDSLYGCWKRKRRRKDGAA